MVKNKYYWILYSVLLLILILLSTYGNIENKILTFYLLVSFIVFDNYCEFLLNLCNDSEKIIVQILISLILSILAIFTAYFVLPHIQNILFDFLNIKKTSSDLINLWLFFPAIYFHGYCILIPGIRNRKLKLNKKLLDLLKDQVLINDCDNLNKYNEDEIHNYMNILIKESDLDVNLKKRIKELKKERYLAIKVDIGFINLASWFCLTIINFLSLFNSINL
ncbi:hypothetical protein [Neisseria animaloris]|uniref:hypothetical protein n=1 Tax=Neisseria animaloris TaxID=326522 RepID=UPI0039E10D8B